MRTFGTLILLLGLVCDPARAGDSFKDFFGFEVGRMAMALRAELRPDGDRRAVVWMGNAGHGGSQFYRQKEWDPVVKAVAAAVDALPQLAAGQSRVFGEGVPASGGRLRIEAFRDDKVSTLRLTRLDEPGGKYPPVVCVVPVADVPRFRQAVEDLAKEFTVPKLSGYR